jgi:hypothetical protein
VALAVNLSTVSGNQDDTVIDICVTTLFDLLEDTEQTTISLSRACHAADR